MFFFLPINTDAPVYHFPWATLSLILANCFVFIGIMTGSVPYEEWMLVYGEMNPLQWVTSNFVHGGVGHLLGNMFLLWGLGLIVEGKIGWRAFLAVYFGIGISECAIEQVCMLKADGASMGASSVIFGLMAMAIVWAPKNEVSFFYLFFIIVFIRVGVFEVTVLTYGLFVIAKEILVFTLMGFHVGTSALHLLGGGIGYGLAVLMLKKDLVDCEGWDLFSVLKGTHGRIIGDPTNVEGFLSGRSKQKKRKRSRKPSRILTESSSEVAVRESADAGLGRKGQARQRILRLIADGKPRAALAELQRQQHTNPEFRLDRGPLLKLAAGLIEHEQWSDSIGLLEEYLERFDKDADAIRIQLALLLMQKQRRPRAALSVLEPVDGSALPSKLDRRRRVIEQQANEMIAAGVIELSGQAFSSASD